MTGLFDHLPVQAAPLRMPQTARGAPMGHAAVMAGRVENADSLDFFPTPPWVARCLAAEILPTVCGTSLHDFAVWEPACGAGHMAGPLAEYAGAVFASDIADYGYVDDQGRRPRLGSFVDLPGAPGIAAPRWCDWVITNPPFNLSGHFVRRALSVAQRGVAIVTRLSWLESIERWSLRQEYPLWACVNFAERVPMFRGRWEPGGSSATAYAVLIWYRHAVRCGWQEPERGMHRGWTVPPGAAERWSRPGDAARWGGAFPRLDGIACT